MMYDEAADFAEKRKFSDDLAEMMHAVGISGAEGWRCLEVGGEGGVLAGLMGRNVSRLISTDVISAQATYEDKFLPSLREKFERNGEIFPLDRVEFLTADAQDLPFKDSWFDFCFSLNAFEHIPDPEEALREAARVTRAGGYIYLMFDPVWTADSGSHFLERIQEPWLHLLSDDDDLSARMSANGAAESEISSFLHHMNRKPISYYREMFPRVIDDIGAQVLIHHEWTGILDPSFADHPNLGLASEKLGLSRDDLLVRGLRYLIQV